MILWNVASKKIEARCAGEVFEFAPNERKKIYNPDIVNHLIFKLRDKGLTAIDEENSGPEAEKKALIDGLKSRWKTLDRVVRNYRTMNKEREANKMTAEAPTEQVQEAAEEASDILEKLKTLEAERYQKIEKYLSDEKTKRAVSEIEESEKIVETKGSFETEIRAKRPGRPRKDAIPSPGNS